MATHRALLDRSKVPKEVLESRDWIDIDAKCNAISESLGDDLCIIELFPNVSLIKRSDREILDGVVYHLRDSAPCDVLIEAIGPLYQLCSVFDIPKIDRVKFENVKKKFTDALQHRTIKGEGHVSPIDTDDAELNVFEAYLKKNTKGDVVWYTSFGYRYPGWVAITREEESGQDRLVVCGGHAKLHRNVSEASRGFTVESLDPYHYKSSPEDTLSQMMCDVKSIQMSNHRAIASDLNALLGGRESIDLGAHKKFPSDITESWRCFYNTVKRSNDTDRGKQLYKLSQGVFDLDTHFEINKADAPISIYVLENDSRILRLKYTKKIVNETTFFPINTGTYRVTPDSNAIIRHDHDIISHMGHGSITDVNHRSHRDYDDSFKGSIDMLLNRQAYSNSRGESRLRVRAFYVTEVDTRDMNTEDVLLSTRHLQDEDSISISWDSKPARRLFKNMTNIVSQLRSNGITDVNIIEWLKKDPSSDYHVTLPVGLLRTSNTPIDYKDSSVKCTVLL